MMTRRADHRERAGDRSGIEHLFDAGEDGASRQESCLVCVGRRERVRIERSGATRGATYLPDIVPIVYGGELIFRGRSRFHHGAPPLPEFRRDHLHDLRAVDALGMTRGGQMVGKTVGSNENQGHAPLIVVDRLSEKSYARVSAVRGMKKWLRLDEMISVRAEAARSTRSAARPRIEPA